MILLITSILICIIIILYIYFNYKYEKFSNINAKEEILNIKKNYDLLYNEKNSKNILIVKNNIDKSIKNIEKILINNYDKYKLNNLYYNELIPLLDNYNKNDFLIVINKIDFLIDYSFNSSYHDFSIIINNIKTEFKNLNILYKDVYINKSNNILNNKNEIEIKIQKIYSLLLKITTHDDLNSSGIILILNTTLKRAYETNDITQINSLILTFDEKIKNLNNKFNNINIDNNKKFDFKGIEIDNNVNIIEPTTTISIHKDRKVIKLIQDDFNNIYNSFDLINIIYKNNGDKKQLIELNDIIFKSIDNIISYNNTDIEYKNKITSIKIIIITPILNKELKESYKINKDNDIIKIKNKFYDGIIEIKNIIINSFTKNRNDNNREICLKEIIEAILNNNYPIEIKKLKGCNNSIFISNNNLTIYPHLAISNNNGKTWNFATDFLEYKNTGNKTSDFLYTYKLATNDGKNLNFIN